MSEGAYGRVLKPVHDWKPEKDTPLYISPIQTYRVWKVYPVPGPEKECVLTSYWRGSHWPTPYKEAECYCTESSLESWGHGCGIYSCRSVLDLDKYVAPWFQCCGGLALIGRASISGTIIEGPKGYRASTLRAEHLLKVCLEEDLELRLSKGFSQVPVSSLIVDAPTFLYDRPERVCNAAQTILNDTEPQIVYL